MRRRKAAPADAVRFLPFVLDESSARAAFAAWTRGLKLAPSGLAQAATIICLAPAWVPLWLASASAAVAWRGKRGTTRFVTETNNGPDGKPSTKSVSRTEYAELSGAFNERFESIVIDAGAALDASVPTLLDQASARHAQSAESLPNHDTATKAARVDRASAEAELRVVADRRARAQVLHTMGGPQCEIAQFDMRLDDVALVMVHCPVFEGRYGYAGVVPTNDGKTTAHINERFEGRFRRVLSLPDDIDPGAVNASYRDGVLHISVQRHASAQPRRIEVQ